MGRSLRVVKSKRRPIIDPAIAVRLLINRLMSEELLSNDRRVEKQEQLNSFFILKTTAEV